MPDHALDRLAATIAARATAGDAEASYTAKLLAKGLPKIAQKLGEEATETVIAALAEGPQAVTAESADLLYHLLVLWQAVGVAPQAVWQELERRHGLSGLAEKASRPPSA